MRVYTYIDKALTVEQRVGRLSIVQSLTALAQSHKIEDCPVWDVAQCNCVQYTLVCVIQIMASVYRSWFS